VNGKIGKQQNAERPLIAISMENVESRNQQVFSVYISFAVQVTV